MIPQAVSLQKTEEYGHYHAEKRHDMVPLNGLALEHHSADDCEYREGYHLLYDLELHQVERASVDIGAYPVCRNHEAVFEKSYAP